MRNHRWWRSNRAIWQAAILPENYHCKEYKALQSNRVIALLAYVIPVISWLYIWNARKGDSLARFHARQAAALFVTAVGVIVAWMVLAWVVSLVPLIGPVFATASFPIVMVSMVFLFVVWILAIVAALQASERKMPVVANVADRVFRS